MTPYEKFLFVVAAGIGCVAVYGLYLKRRIEHLRKLIGRERLAVLREEARRASGEGRANFGDDGPRQGGEGD